jgi:outer membrane immunogenic protein
MKKALIGIAAVAAIIGPPALAADMAVKAPIVTKAPPVAVSTWTGCYGGINGGAAWGRSNINTTFSAPPGLAVNLPFANEVDSELSPHLHPVSGTAGAQLGCNWQSSSFVAGVETDFDYMGLKKNVSTQVPASIVDPVTQTVTTATTFAMHWLYTLRGRVGVTQGDWLFYATGGLALTRISYSANYTNIALNFFPPALFENEAASAARTRAGWTVGAGVERKITGTKWSGRLEYLYADFGSITTMGQIVTLGVPDRIFLTNHVPFNVQILRAGLNYSLN